MECTIRNQIGTCGRKKNYQREENIFAPKKKKLMMLMIFNSTVLLSKPCDSILHSKHYSGTGDYVCVSMRQTSSRHKHRRMIFMYIRKKRTCERETYDCVHASKPDILFFPFRDFYAALYKKGKGLSLFLTHGVYINSTTTTMT
jgi:hypothetical protein